jgi:hypothetical protein
MHQSEALIRGHISQVLEARDFIAICIWPKAVVAGLLAKAPGQNIDSGWHTALASKPNPTG